MEGREQNEVGAGNLCARAACGHLPYGCKRVTSVRHNGVCCHARARARAMGPCATMDQRVSAFPERVERQAVQPLEAKQYRAILGRWDHEAAPLWCVKLTEPGRGCDVANGIDYQRAGDLGDVLEAIGA